MVIHSNMFTECKKSLFKEIENGLGLCEADGKPSIFFFLSFFFFLANANVLTYSSVISLFAANG